AWRLQVVAGDEVRRQSAHALVGNVVPDGPRQQQRMEPDGSVRGPDSLGARLPPDLDHAVDRARIDRGAVAEHDHGRLDLLAERSEAAPDRRARAALPVVAPNRAGARPYVVGAEDDE